MKENFSNKEGAPEKAGLKIEWGKTSEKARAKAAQEEFGKRRVRGMAIYGRQC